MRNLKLNKFSHFGLIEGVVLTLFLFVFFGCNSSFKTKKELWEYLKKENNGYLKVKSVNGYRYELLYKPTDLLIEQELSGLNYDSKEEFEKLRNKYEKNMYFILSISKGNKEVLSVSPRNKYEFGVMVKQLVFGMRERVCLYTQGRDTLEMLDYNYPRMYGMSRSTNIMFVFSRDQKYLSGKYLNFTISDLIKNTGEVRFKLSIDKIKKEPKLQFVRNDKE